MMKRKFLALLLCVVALPSLAQKSDVGLQLSAGVAHNLSKKVSISFEGAMRTRNDFKTMDRWSAEIGAAYKFNKYVKVSGGYSLLVDNNKEKISYGDEGGVEKWRPSYWGVRHRFNVAVTGSIEWSRLTFSLRECWQYTYRPERTTDRYDFEDEEWEKKSVAGHGKNLLRSRFAVEYNIPKCKFDPYASIEIFNGWSLQKTRIIGGVDWKINKHHNVGAFYRYQIANDNDDDNEANSHIIGLGYKYKF